MSYEGRPIDFGPGECDECGDTGTVAKFGGWRLCGDCCKRGMHAAGVEEEEDDSEEDALRDEISELKDEKNKLADQLEDAQAEAKDAQTALAEQEKLAADLAAKLDRVKRVTDGIPLLPEPKPRKPRAKKTAEVPT